MKRTIIFSLAVGTFALTATSCMEIDNFDAPESRFTGSIIDVTTGKPILADQGHGQVRIWEVSFENADPQDIPIKQDGTYNNERLFPGHYDMCPLGSWWPCDTIRAIQLGTQTIQNFEVTPYLQVLNFEATHVVGPTMDTLILSCRLKAPIPNGMPNITDIRPFLSRNQFCGDGNKLDYYHNNTYRINRAPVNWAALAKDPDDPTMSAPQVVRVPVKRGWTYSVRMGARVDDTQKKYNYSEIKIISIPQ